jgi:hypothetical protein
MRNKRDLQLRIRLDSSSRACIELVQVALNREPLTQEERQAYCSAVEDMVHAAKARLVPVQEAVERLEKEARRTTA